MRTLTIHLLETLACSGLLLTAYAFLLERRVGFGWCRAYLLLSTALAGIIPLLRIPVWPGEVVVVAPLPAVAPETAAPTAVATALPEPAYTAEAICSSIYGLGVALLCGLMLWQMLRIRRLRRRAAIVRTERYTLVRTEERIASFSFFRSIYVWKNTPAGKLDAIVAHEASHIAHRHSLERIAMELMKAAMWWNPFVWIAARRLTEAEEFEADSDVLCSGFRLPDYMNTIFEQLFGYSPEIANGLRDSLTKKRFQMMTAPRSSRHALLRLAATLPAFVGLICAFSFTAKATEYRIAEPAEAAASGDPCRVSLRIFADGEPLPGVIVAAAGTKQGSVTDSEGRAEIAAPQGSVLNIQYVGYATATVEVAARPAMTAEVVLQHAGDTSATVEAAPRTAMQTEIALRPEDTETAEVSVLVYLLDKERQKNYSTARKAVGAILKAVNGTQASVADTEGCATLRVPRGTVLEVLYPEYEPATVVAETSFATTVGLLPEGNGHTQSALYTRDEYGVKQTPLYIIDGVERPSMEQIDASQIASIDVIKDESALRTYGERARNGVVVIRTKWFEEQLRRKAGASAPETTATDSPVAAARTGEAQTEEEAYIVAEQMPRFEGRDLPAFRQWVQEQIRYPEQAQGAEGRVIATFVVGEDGSVEAVRIIASPHQLLSDEVHRVIAASPRWTPGMQQGKPVRVKYALPIEFRLHAPAASDAPETPATGAATQASASDIPAAQTPAPESADATSGGQTLRYGEGDAYEFRRWMQAHLRYPAEAKAAGAQGRVVVRFTVGRDGSVSDIRTLRSPDRALSDEVTRVVRASSGHWPPANVGGEPAAISLAVPVLFRIAGSTTPAADSDLMPPTGGDIDEIVVTTYAD